MVLNKSKIRRQILFSSLLLLWSCGLSEACLCHLIPNYTCPPPPHCCESGQYTFDECGCCLTCAKSELQPCGGPSSSSGKCAQGLACLKTCTACKTIGSAPEPCLFPFEYQGEIYDRCTTVDALESGTAWCATEVYDNKTVIDGKWGDCDEGCPGARHACDERRFSILIGKCINPNVPGAIPNWHGAPPYRLLDKTEDLFSAPLCAGDNSKRRRQYVNTCRCASGEDSIEIDEDGSVRGNCTGVDNDEADGVNPVWCFLENIRDPANPISGCYPDTTWSPKDGRFWSAEACNGLPPLEGDDLSLPDSTNFPLGEKNPLFQAALKTPFRRPEEVFDIEVRETTQAPKKSKKKNRTSSTTEKTTSSTTSSRADQLELDVASFDDDDDPEILLDEYQDLFDDPDDDFIITGSEPSKAEKGPVSTTTVKPETTTPASGIPIDEGADVEADEEATESEADFGVTTVPTDDKENFFPA